MDQFNAVSQAPSADMYSILMQRPDEAAASETYRVTIGTQSDGTMLSADLEQITHMLVCGYSGSGKTSFVQTAALYLARNHSPKHIQFIVFDSKMVDYAAFRDLPHLSKPIINDDAKADETISWLEKESDRRLTLIHDIGAKDIVSYNQQCSLPRQETLPRILLIMDDFASLQMYKKYNTPMTLISVLQNGRIAGIHVVLVTSVTSSKILPKNLLSLIPFRISFCVSERADSRLAIDKEGAETLRVPGELMIRYQSVLQKCKGAYLSENQMPSVMKKIQRDNLLQVSTLGDMAEQIFREISDHNKQESNQLYSEDQLIRMVMDRCVELGQISTTVIQRHLKIGYAKAARILDHMEDLGLIGPSEGAKPRRLLISPTQWASMRNHNNALSSNKPSFASNSSTDFSNADNARVGSQGATDIILRDFEEFTVDSVKLSVHDNRVFIRKQIMTPYGKGYANPNFDGKSIARLIYKKPHLLFRGHIQFIIKAAAKLTNPNPEIKSYKREDLTDLLTVQFRTSDAKTVNAFMKQISEDIGIALTVL